MSPAGGVSGQRSAAQEGVAWTSALLAIGCCVESFGDADVPAVSILAEAVGCGIGTAEKLGVNANNELLT